MNARFVIFDFDGVIVDSFAVAYGFYQRYAPGDISADEFRSWFNGNILAKEGRRKETRHLLPPTDEYHIEYSRLLLPVRPIPDIPEVLAELDPRYALSILSSNRLDVIEPYLQKCNLRQYFDEILDRDTSRSKVEKLHMLLQSHNATPTDTIFITDTLGDIREAAEVGVKCIGVSWGFHSRATLEEGKPLLIVDHPLDLVGAIDGYFAEHR